MTATPTTATTTQPSRHAVRHARSTGMWDAERQHPWLARLYLAAFLLTILLSALLSGCGGGDPEDNPLDRGDRKTIDPPICSASEVCL